MSEYSAEELLRLSQFVKDMQSILGGSRDDNDDDEARAWDDYEKASSALAVYAKRIERAQSGVTDGVVDVAHDTIFGHPSFDIGENGFLGKPAVRAALLAVWPNPPVAQDDWRIGFFERWREAAHEKGYAGIAEAITAAPTAILRGTAPTAAPPIDLAAVRKMIAHLRSFRSNTPPTWAHLDDAADKLEAALPELKP